MRSSSSSRSSMKKTSSFLMNNPKELAKTNHPRPVQKIEYPASPQIILGEEKPRHTSHPQHPLSLLDVSDLFTCSGCKEYGSGFRFTCQQCEFQLHEFCALAPPVLKEHSFHRQHHLYLHSKPVKGGILKSKCDVCWKPTKGYTFRCNACSYQMDPCCAMLSDQINISVHPHLLKLLPANSPNGDSASGIVCGECRRKRSGRVYRCTVCEYHLHAVCAKNMVNGLEANGIKGPETPSMLGTAARLASQVFVEFIGGIIEGLGEGVGEMFVQSITRGRRPAVSSNNSRD
ncbi:CYSTEINE/HISTIDINE-RICH C1 DOMAIN FAMILY PROTEIN [Salix viminalis]|uniref:CYSTEINE/HISTIDINE-RICH C1 DOMAIN FAMILY PROTEIN n=1 Tax=Salix viminalis TaxID=40686 RepID=A0A9Q0UUE1_SALVM|nr:CYSTEINE/HISTIDINE-RICH C1 DOMAIN FAMILY PROTEIN [Salix viminalis]